jgi:hypothetical protein
MEGSRRDYAVAWAVTTFAACLIAIGRCVWAFEDALADCLWLLPVVAAAVTLMAVLVYGVDTIRRRHTDDNRET